ncbi:hypothetical protein ABIA96_006903, partial [Bradyrhizobium sp. LB11.1]
MLREVIRSLTVGIRRRWKIGVTRALSVVGAIWLATEIVTRVSKTADNWVTQQGNIYLATVIVAGVIWFLVYTYELRSVSFLIPTTGSRIDIRFGDLLAEQTDWLIGVGEFFDSEIGLSWSRKSEQRDKWSFCLTAGKIDPRIRRDDE